MLDYRTSTRQYLLASQARIAAAAQHRYQALPHLVRPRDCRAPARLLGDEYLIYLMIYGLALVVRSGIALQTRPVDI